MANINTNLAAVPIAASGPPVANACGSSTAADGVSADSTAGSEGLSFNDLMNGAAGTTDSGDSSSAAADDGTAADADGEGLPLGGNALPLVLPVILPVLPPIAQAVAAVATAIESVGESTAAGSSEVKSPPAPMAATQAATSASAAAAPEDGVARAEEVLQALNDSHAAARPFKGEANPAAKGLTKDTPDAARDKPIPDGLRTALEAVSQSHKVDKGPAAPAAPTADGAVAAAIAARLARANGRDADATDGSDSSDRLSSLPASTGREKSPHTTAQTNTSQAAANALDALAASGRSLPAPADIPPATAAQQLLREFKFERSSESVTSTSSVGTTHTAGLQPSAASAAPDDVPVTQLQTPVQNQQQWADGLGERIVWMANNNHQNAQIRLNPAHLGPIEVQVSVAGDQTNISFTAHHAATRDALEAAAPRLRDMLGTQGMGNVNVSIHHQSAGDRLAQNTPQESWQNYPGSSSAETQAIDDGVRSAPLRSTRSLIDAYV